MTDREMSYIGRASVASVGCKVNRYDALTAENALAGAGYEIVGFPAVADVYVVNTCAVTGEAAKKSRAVIRRAVKLNPGAVVVVCGCWSKLEREVAEAIPGVSFALGTEDYSRIAEIVATARDGAHNEQAIVAGGDVGCGRTLSTTRAYLKIQDGCNNRCSYCVIPFARGPVKSRPIEEILREAREIAQKGVKEIVLTGIHVASYGKDLAVERNSVKLEDVCEAVCSVDGIERLRLSSLSPAYVTEGFVERLSRLDKLCGYFHLSLQSGSARVLKAMNRGYTKESYHEAVRLLTGAFPDCAVWSDVIAGFPGETDDDFDEGFAFIEGAGIVKLHVFPFSAKKGTAAYDMAGRVPGNVAAERVSRLLALDAALYRRFLEERIGARYGVLFESADTDGEHSYYTGHTDNNIMVRVRSDKSLINCIETVRISGVKEGGNGVPEVVSEVCEIFERRF